MTAKTVLRAAKASLKTALSPSSGGRLTSSATHGNGAGAANGELIRKSRCFSDCDAQRVDHTKTQKKGEEKKNQVTLMDVKKKWF